MTAATQAIDLPADFDPCSWHTLRLVRRARDLSICLDGPPALAVTLPEAAFALGLVTRAAGAAFTSVWYTGVAPDDRN
jgi:hypothetical protein